MSSSCERFSWESHRRQRARRRTVAVRPVLVDLTGNFYLPSETGVSDFRPTFRLTSWFQTCNLRLPIMADSMDAVFVALGSPSRRKILDIVKNRPGCTVKHVAGFSK